MSLPKGPVGQLDARRGGPLLHRPFQLLLLRLVKGGGTTGLLEYQGRRACPRENGGPPSPKADAQRPMVWGSRSSASAVAAAVKP